MSHKFHTGKLGGILSTSSLVVAFLKFQIPIPKSQGKLNRQIEEDHVVYRRPPFWNLGFDLYFGFGTCSLDFLFIRVHPSLGRSRSFVLIG